MGSVDLGWNFVAAVADSAKDSVVVADPEGCYSNCFVACGGY